MCFRPLNKVSFSTVPVLFFFLFRYFRFGAFFSCLSSSTRLCVYVRSVFAHNCVVCILIPLTFDISAKSPNTSGADISAADFARPFSNSFRPSACHLPSPRADPSGSRGICSAHFRRIRGRHARGVERLGAPALSVVAVFPCGDVTGAWVGVAHAHLTRTRHNQRYYNFMFENYVFFVVDRYLFESSRLCILI